jgi:putative Ca2+/H+ antiporter (TMEM165/GDT1 family)
MIDNDPLWRLRHALLGMALALLASVFIAALAGRWIADLFADSYGLRVAVYSGLLVYVIVGAVLLFKRVAQHETRPVSAQRLALWLASLWLWPVLLLGRRAPPAPPGG